MKKQWLLSAMLSLTVLTAGCERLSLPEQSQRKEATMGVSNGIVSGPINPREVYALLGVPKYNGWWDIGYICSNKHGKTNKWAKFKPVRHEKLGEITDMEKFFKNYGIDVESALTLTASDLISKANAGSGYGYLPPRGGSYNEEYRMLDFTGYNHNAAGNLFTFTIPDSVPTTGTSVSMQLHFTFNPKADLKITDFVEFSDYGNIDMYHYAVAYYTSADNVRLAHGPGLADVEGGDVYIDIDLPGLGLWKCILVVTMEQGSTIGGTYTAYIPGGLFNINVYRRYIYADVTITNDFSGLWMDNSGIYGFYYPSLTIADAGDFFPASKGLLALTIYYYAKGGTGIPVGSFYVEDDPANVFSFVGIGTKSLTVEFLQGENIEFSKFASGIDFSNIEYVRMEAWVKSMDGTGNFRMKGTYQWTVRRK